MNNETEVVLRLLADVIGNCDDETNFPYKLFLSNRQVLNLRKALVIVLQLISSYQKFNYLK